MKKISGMNPLRRLRSKLQRFTGRARGQGLVEFALVFPVLLLILASIADMGLLYLTAQTVQHASREGARMAVKLEDLTANDTRVSAYVESQIPNIGLYSGFFGGVSNNAIADCAVSDEITVTVSGNYNFVALNIIGLDNVTLSFPTKMRYEKCN